MISVSSRKTVRFLGLIILSLSAMNLLVNLARCFLGRGGLWGVSRLFDLDTENNIPTWYASVTLLICSGLFALIAQRRSEQGDRFVSHWRGLSLLFLWMSIDEAASIHEILIGLNEPLQTSGFLYYAWVLPAMVLLVILGFAYRRFVLALPRKVKQRFLLAIGIYILGGLFMEMVGGKYQQITGIQTPVPNGSGFTGMGMALILAAEEMLEMIGVALLIYTLLQLLSQEVDGFKLYFGRVTKQTNLEAYPPKAIEATTR